MLANGSASDMTGVPIVLKDNLCVLGQRAGAASKILDNYIATYDATIVERLRAASSFAVRARKSGITAKGSTTKKIAENVTSANVTGSGMDQTPSSLRLKAGS